MKKKLHGRHGRFPTTDDIVSFCADIRDDCRLAGTRLLRIYYYDCPPFEGTAKHPITGEITDFSKTPQASQNTALLDSLELQPDFAVRRGVLLRTGWKLGSSTLRRMAKGGSTSLGPKDLVPDINQKGVDMRIGLDIATIAIKRIVDVLVLVTGDSDFVPAMKLARKEGLRVYLQALGHSVRRELKAHADVVL